MIVNENMEFLSYNTFFWGQKNKFGILIGLGFIGLIICGSSRM